MTDDTRLAAQLADAVEEYSRRPDARLLRKKLDEFAAETPAETIVALAEPYRDEPEVIAPLYERVVDREPHNAPALVRLANAYWLQGRGPEVVGELANRAIAADPTNRGAWHLWALSESDPRQRTMRWRQVTDRFPDDNLAVAAAADNAAAVAGAERDYEMLDLSIELYGRLLDRSTESAQRQAVENALRALRGWRF